MVKDSIYTLAEELVQSNQKYAVEFLELGKKILGTTDRLLEIEVLFLSKQHSADDFYNQFVLKNIIKFDFVLRTLIFYQCIDYVERLIAIAERRQENQFLTAIFRGTINNIKIYIDKIKQQNVKEISKIISLTRFVEESSASIESYSNKCDTIDYRINVLVKRPKLSKTVRPIENLLLDFKSRDVLLKSKFDRLVVDHGVDKIYLLRNARLGGFNNDNWVLYDEERRYVKEQGMKFPALTGLTIEIPANREIEKVYVLAFPHTANNYYHIVSEAVYSLRLLSYFEPNTPILYIKDKYNVVEFFLNKMGISQDRWISADKARGIIFKRAYLIGRTNFYWNKDIYTFFSKFSCPPKSDFKKIYVSRAFSNDGIRKLKNERELENKLSTMGFQIIHSEKLSLDEQIQIFSSAEIIVTPHGAGLTNILFCHAGFELVELFSENFITSDFFLRSFHSCKKYTPIICVNNYVQIDDVVNAIS